MINICVDDYVWQHPSRPNSE